MRFIVLVKQVPDTTEMRIDPETNTLIRDGVPSILNPFDQFALEEAIRVRNEFNLDAEIVVISMGPPQAKDAIMKCLALGADRGILLTDRKFAGADTVATSYALANAIRTMGDFDMIFAGQQAIDGDTAQVGPETAAILGIPQVTYVEKVLDFKPEEKKVVLYKQLDVGYAHVEAEMPVLITGAPPTDFEPSNPSLMNIMKAKKKPYEEWDAERIDGDQSKYGLLGSPTRVVNMYTPEVRKAGEVLKDISLDEMVEKTVEFMLEKGLLNYVRRG